MNLPPAGYLLRVAGHQIDQQKRYIEVANLLSIAIVEPSHAKRRLDWHMSRNVLDTTDREETFEWLLDDDTRHQFSFMLDGRAKQMTIGDDTITFDVGDRFVIVLDEDWNWQLFRETDLDDLPISNEEIEALRGAWRH